VALTRHFEFLLANAKTDLDVFWTNKGNVLAELGNWTDALACFDRALEVNSNHAPTLTQRTFALTQVEK
jgi:tetratricopeptide (TPR) repeat protein